jgi:prolipoprotein diacylglyceryltransferase
MLAVFTSWLYWFDRRQPSRFGTGYYTWIYLLFYCLVRFLLDFIRIDKPAIWYGLGLNQLVLLAVVIVLLLYRHSLIRYVKK